MRASDDCTLVHSQPSNRHLEVGSWDQFDLAGWQGGLPEKAALVAGRAQLSSPTILSNLVLPFNVNDRAMNGGLSSSS